MAPLGFFYNLINSSANHCPRTIETRFPVVIKSNPFQIQSVFDPAAYLAAKNLGGNEFSCG